VNIGTTGYIGWVVWVDNVPIFQSVPTNFGLKQPALGAYYPNTRHADRNTLDWKDLPHDRVQRLELYGFHDFYTHQPLFRMDKPADALDVVRYACMTMGGVAFGGHLSGPARTGIAGWKLGWLNTRLMEYDIWKITREGRFRIDNNGEHLPEGGAPHKGHPCWPRPHGFGIGPHVFGLTESQVGSPPTVQT
jgi:hypothetical protein